MITTAARACRRVARFAHAPTPSERSWRWGRPPNAFSALPQRPARRDCRRHLADIVALEAAHGRDTLIAALEQALLFRRFTSDDIRAIIAAGPHAPTPTDPGGALDTDLPAVPSRDLDAYGLDQLRLPEVSS